MGVLRAPAIASCASPVEYWPMSSDRSRPETTVGTKLAHDPAEVEEDDLDGAGAHFMRWARCSPTRKAFAMIVSAGFTAELDGKKLPSTT